MDEKKAIIKTGIVLSGGMSKGAYEIGFLNAIKKHTVFSPAVLSTASVGTLNGYALSTGKIPTANDVWKSINTSTMIETYKSIFSKKAIYSVIDSYYDKSDVLSIPIYTVCWHPPEINPSYILLNHCTHQEIKDYLKASVTVAPVMKPYKVNNKLLFDGAILDNSPIAPILKFKLDLIIVIQFDNYISQTIYNPLNIPILYLNLQENNSTMESFNFSSAYISRMIEYAQNTSDTILSDLESEIMSGNRLNNKIDYYNSSMLKTIYNGDYVIRKINKITKIISKTKY